jgi:predicted AAA+ superfamily ATPase
LLTYQEKQFKLSFLRVSDTQEIDLIVEKGNKTFLVEIKSSKRADERMSTSLRLLGSAFDNPQLRILSNDNTIKQFGDVLAVHWKEGIKEIIEA